MSDLVVTSIGQTGAQFFIENLSSGWNTTNYSQAYLTTSPVPSGGASSISGYGIVSGTNLQPTDATSTSTTTQWGSISGLSPSSTYTYYASIQTPSAGTWYPAGSYTFTTQAARPSLFNWSISKNSGVQLQVSAAEISNLQSNVNSVRSYKGYAPYSFTSWSVGQTANSVALWLEIYNAIATLNPPQVAQVPNNSTVFTNSSFFASYRNSINSVT